MSNQVQPMDAFRPTLQKMADQFVKALPPQIPAERFMRVVETAVGANPALLDADRRSLLASCMRAAQDGLLLDGREAALVTFGNIVTYMPMTSGILKKIRNSGELKSLSSGVVYEGDKFEHWTDEEGEHFKHNPNYEGERGKPKLVFAFASTKDGGRYLEVMTLAQIDQVRSVSRAGKKGPWVDWWDEMARKSVIRRLAKRLPMSTDLDSFMRTDDELTDLNAPQVVKDVTPAPVRPTRLESVVSENDVTHNEPTTDEDGMI